MKKLHYSVAISTFSNILMLYRHNKKKDCHLFLSRYNLTRIAFGSTIFSTQHFTFNLIFDVNAIAYYMLSVIP